MGNLPTLNRRLMEFFGDNPGEKSFKEILEYFKNIKRKNRKKRH